MLVESDSIWRVKWNVSIATVQVKTKTEIPVPIVRITNWKILTKTIDTLVEDIYGLFTDGNGWSPDPKNVEEFGQRLAQHIANRASEDKGTPQLRLSNLGYPNRKLWYTVNQGGLSETLPPEARIKFLFGDILEELLLFLAKEAGHTVTGAQDTVEIAGVKGHRDAVIDGHLVDCKSASSYSFRKFEDHGLSGENADPFGYLTQLGSYHSASPDADPDTVSFLVIDKTLGKICLDTWPRDTRDYQKIVEEKRKVLSLPKPPEEKCYPDEPEGKSGNRKLSVSCSYCPFKWTCWKGLRGFAYSSGPVYLTKTTREPKVHEFDKDGNQVHKF